VGADELVEPEGQGRRLLAPDEQQPRLDVVRAAELVPLAEDQLPALPGRDPVLEDGGVRGEVLVDLDLDRRVRPFRGRLAWLNEQVCHGCRVPPAVASET